MKRALPLVVFFVTIAACSSEMPTEPPPALSNATYTIMPTAGPLVGVDSSRLTGESYIVYKTADGTRRIDNPELPFSVTVPAAYPSMELHLEGNTLALRASIEHKGTTTSRTFQVRPYAGTVVWYE